MFKKFKKLVFGFLLIGITTNANSNMLPSNMNYLGVSSSDIKTLFEFSAKIMISEIINSLKNEGPTQQFTECMKVKNMACQGFSIMKSKTKSSAKSTLFETLFDIFSKSDPLVTIDQINSIIDSASDKCSEACEIIEAALGGVSISEISKNPEKKILVENDVKEKIQSIINESSSDSDNSGTDFNESDSWKIEEEKMDNPQNSIPNKEVYQKNSDSDEIQQLKSYLQIPKSRELSLADLHKIKANRDISLSQIWLGNVSLPSANKEDLFRKINEALESYQTYVILGKHQEGNNEFGKDPRYLWTLMGMLHSYKDKLSKNISVDKVLESLYPNKSEREDILKKSNNDMGKLIYFWLLDNAPEVLGEYTM